MVRASPPSWSTSRLPWPPASRSRVCGAANPRRRRRARRARTRMMEARHDLLGIPEAGRHLVAHSQLHHRGRADRLRAGSLARDLPAHHRCGDPGGVRLRHPGHAPAAGRDLREEGIGGDMSEVVLRHLPAIVVANFIVVALVLVGLGRVLTARPLQEVPNGRQNAAELALDWFVTQARAIEPRRVALIAPFLATLFFLILGSNLLALLPIPLLRIPPTSYFSGPFALALVAVFGVMVVAARLRGVGAMLRHLVWPNPLQLVGEVSHTLSLSLRLYGN